MADRDDFADRLGKALKARDDAAVDLTKEAFEAFKDVWTALDRLDAQVQKAVPGSEFKRTGGPEQVAQGMVEVKYHGKNGEGTGRRFSFLIKDARLIAVEGMKIEDDTDDSIESFPAFEVSAGKVLVAHVERELIAWLSAPRPKRVVRLWE